MPTIEYADIKTHISGNQKTATIFHKLGRKVLQISVCYTKQTDGVHLLTRDVIVWSGPDLKRGVNYSNKSDGELNSLTDKVSVVSSLQEVTDKAQFTKSELEDIKL